MNWRLVFLLLLALLLGVPSLLTQPFAEHCFIREFSSVTQYIVLLCPETFGGFVVPHIIIVFCSCLVVAQLGKMSFHTKQKSMVLVHTVLVHLHTVLVTLPCHQHY